MAIACPVGFDIQGLRREVSAVYRDVALDPAKIQHFHTGPAYAVNQLGYDAVSLSTLPESCTASFAGVGNPHRIGAYRMGQIVLDVGCGAGTDLLLAAREVSPTGMAIGVDMTPAMRDRARTHARAAGLDRVVDIRPGLAEDLPVADERIDVVISNGVINLATDKAAAYSEIFRVLKPGGELRIADVIIQIELNEHERSDVGLWAA